MVNNSIATDQPQLFFFPFAGASFYSYNGLVKNFIGMQITTIELPGRGKRVQDPLLSNINDMADYIFDQIKEKLCSPYAFFGHSLGSILAYEVTLRILDNQLPPPTHLFVSGRGGPGVLSRDKNSGTLSREKFHEKLKKYGGTPAQVLKEKELMAFFEPMLRADFTAAENYIGNDRKIFMPVTVFNGTQDTVTRKEALKWQDITDTPITLKEFIGGHFFIFDHGKAVCDTISKLWTEN